MGIVETGAGHGFEGFDRFGVANGSQGLGNLDPLLGAAALAVEINQKVNTLAGCLFCGLTGQLLSGLGANFDPIRNL